MAGAGAPAGGGRAMTYEEEIEMRGFYESRGWWDDHQLAWCQCLQKAKNEVILDVLAGIVPATVRSFSELHDHVDANAYGWGFEDGLPDVSSDAFTAFANGIQDAVHEWLASGGLRRALNLVAEGE